MFSTAAGAFWHTQKFAELYPLGWGPDHPLAGPHPTLAPVGPQVGPPICMLEKYAGIKYTKMRRGKNTCRWLLKYTTETCGKSCHGEYCKIHLAVLRKGTSRAPCLKCGVGVSNKEQLCISCGYQTALLRSSRRRQQTFEAEFKRLARIEF